MTKKSTGRTKTKTMKKQGSYNVSAQLWPLSKAVKCISLYQFRHLVEALYLSHFMRAHKVVTRRNGQPDNVCRDTIDSERCNVTTTVLESFYRKHLLSQSTILRDKGCWSSCAWSPRQPPDLVFLFGSTLVLQLRVDAPRLTFRDKLARLTIGRFEVT